MHYDGFPCAYFRDFSYICNEIINYDYEQTNISAFFALGMTVFIQAQSYIVSKHIGTENGLSNNFIQDMVIDKRGFVWVATESGVNRVAGKTVNVYRCSDAGSSRGSLPTWLLTTSLKLEKMRSG